MHRVVFIEKFEILKNRYGIIEIACASIARRYEKWYNL